MLGDMLMGFHHKWSEDEAFRAKRDILPDRSVPADIRAHVLSHYYQVAFKEGVLRFDDRVPGDLRSLVDDPTPVPPAVGDFELDLPDALALANLFEEAQRLRLEAPGEGMAGEGEDEEAAACLTIG